MNMNERIFDFHRSVGAGSFRRVKEFFDKNERVPGLNKNLQYAMGATWIIPLPLVVAFQNGYYDIARFLIANGADLDAYCYKNHVTPRELMPKDFVLEEVKTPDIIKDFLWKVRDGKLEEVKAFLDNAPNTVLNENLIIRNKLYPLPLALAFKKNRREIARLLIDRGADIEAYCNKLEKNVKDLMPKNF